jgi:hypothetical protein
MIEVRSGEKKLCQQFESDELGLLVHWVKIHFAFKSFDQPWKLGSGKQSLIYHFNCFFISPI